MAKCRKNEVWNEKTRRCVQAKYAERLVKSGAFRYSSGKTQIRPVQLTEKRSSPKSASPKERFAYTPLVGSIPRNVPERVEKKPWSVNDLPYLDTLIYLGILTLSTGKVGNKTLNNDIDRRLYSVIKENAGNERYGNLFEGLGKELFWTIEGKTKKVQRANYKRIYKWYSSVIMRFPHYPKTKMEYIDVVNNVFCHDFKEMFALYKILKIKAQNSGVFQKQALVLLHNKAQSFDREAKYLGGLSELIDLTAKQNADYFSSIYRKKEVSIQDVDDNVLPIFQRMNQMCSLNVRILEKKKQIK